MFKSIAPVSLVVIFYILFLVCLFTGYDVMAYNMSNLLSPLIMLIYLIFVKRKTIPFTLFLMFYSVSDFLAIFSSAIPYKIDYFVGNSLYILSYIALLVEICKSVCVIKVLKNFKIHMMVLAVLNTYIVYVLQSVLGRYVPLSAEYFMELVYNIVMLILLSTSLINYFYKDTKKSLYLFIGALCIVFAEVIGVAYMYITNEDLHRFLSVTLYLLAFFFLFKQFKIEYEEVDNRLLSKEV